MSLLCKDINGKVLEKLYQWDMGQRVVLSGVESYGTTYFHFSNDQCGDVYLGDYTLDRGEYTVEVPNILLQEDKPIRLYIFNQIGDETAITSQMVCIPVFPRPRPSGYVYENNIDYIRYEDLSAEIKELRDMIESGSFGNGDGSGSGGGSGTVSAGAVLYSSVQRLNVGAKTTAKNNIGIFVSDSEPSDASDGDIWVNTNNDTIYTMTTIHVVDVGNTDDLTSIDFSKYAVGDIILATMSS